MMCVSWEAEAHLALGTLNVIARCENIWTLQVKPLIPSPLKHRPHKQLQWAATIQRGMWSGGQRITHNIAGLTVRLLLHGKEWLATQLGAAGHADEAVDVEDLVHGRTAGTFAHYVLPAAGTAACGEEEDRTLRTDSAGNQRSNSVTTLKTFKGLHHGRRQSETVSKHQQMLCWQLTAGSKEGLCQEILPRHIFNIMWK